MYKNRGVSMGNSKYNYDDLSMYDIKFEVTELLYAYLDNIRCFKNNEFTFTTEYEIKNKNIHFDIETPLIITKRKNEVPDDFFGENISSINLIVGKNGSGKSTLLSLLTDLNDDRHTLENSYFNQNKKRFGWFVVYKTNLDNIFYIEGYNPTYLNIDLYKVKEESKELQEYSILYNNDKNIFISFYDDIIIKYPSIISFKKRNFINRYSNMEIFKKITEEINHLDEENNMVKFKNDNYIKKTMPIYALDNNSYLKLFKYLNNQMSLKNKTIETLNARSDVKLELSFNVSKPEYQHYLKILKEFDVYNYCVEKKVIPLCNNIDRNLDYQDAIYILIINYLYDNLPLLYKRFVSEIDDIKKITKKLVELSYEQGRKITESDLRKYIYIGLVKALIDLHQRYKKINIKLINEIDLSKDESDPAEIIRKKIDALLSENFNYAIKLYEKGYMTVTNYVNLLNYYSIHFRIPFNDKNNTSIINFLSSIDKIKDILSWITFCDFNVIEISFGDNISEGELQSISSYTDIYHAITLDDTANKIIFLDEPDKGFHPEWIRKFINNIVSLSKESSCKCQFIITTHSPFMLSDVPNELITKIEVDEKNNKKRIVSKAKKSFASNYYDLIKDNFFLGSTLGGFAEEKINKIIDIIRDTENNILSKKNSDDKNCFAVNEMLNEHDFDYDNLCALINVIDEPFIQKTLKSELDRVYKLLIESDESTKIDEEIRILKKRLKELEDKKKSGELND